MILKDLFNVVNSTTKAVNKSIKGSLKFMDELLEKEVIVGSIVDVKEATGKVVEKSGELYQRTVDKIEDLRNTDEEE